MAKDPLKKIVGYGDIESDYGLLRRSLAELGLSANESGVALTATQDIVGATIAGFFQQSAAIHGGTDVLPSEYMRRNPDVYQRIMNEPVDWSFARDVEFKYGAKAIKLGDVTPAAFQQRTIGDSMRWLVSNVMGGTLAANKGLDLSSGVGIMENFLTGATEAISNIPNYRASKGGFANFFLSTAENASRAWRRNEAELSKATSSISSSPTMDADADISAADYGRSIWENESSGSINRPFSPMELVGRGINRAWRPMEDIQLKLLNVQHATRSTWGNYTTISENDPNASTILLDHSLEGTPLEKAGVKQGDFIPGLGDLLHNPDYAQDLADIDDQLWSGGSVRMMVASPEGDQLNMRRVDLTGDVGHRVVLDPVKEKNAFLRQIANRMDPAYGLHVSGVRSDVPESTSSSFAVPTNLYTSNPKARGGMIPKSGNHWEIGSFSLGPTKENQYQVQLTARTINGFADALPEYERLLRRKQFAESDAGKELAANIKLMKSAVRNIDKVTLGRSDRSTVAGEDSIGAFEVLAASSSSEPTPFEGGHLWIGNSRFRRARREVQELGVASQDTEQAIMAAYGASSNLNASTRVYPTTDGPKDIDTSFMGGDVETPEYNEGEDIPSTDPSAAFSIEDINANNRNYRRVYSGPREDRAVEEASAATALSSASAAYEGALSVVDESGLMQRAGIYNAEHGEIVWGEIDGESGSRLSKAAAAALANGQTGFTAKNKQRELYMKALHMAGRRDLVARATMVGKDPQAFSQDVRMVAGQYGSGLRYDPGHEAQFFDDYDELSIKNPEAANAVAALFPEHSSQLRALDYLAKRNAGEFIGPARRELSRQESVRQRALRDQEITMDTSPELNDLYREIGGRDTPPEITINQEARRAGVADVRSSVDFEGLKARGKAARAKMKGTENAGDPEPEAHRQYGHGSNAKYSSRQLGEMRRGRGMFDPETGMINENTPMPAHTFARNGSGLRPSKPADASEPPEMDPGYWASIMGAGSGGEPPDEPPDLYATADPTPEPKRSSGSNNNAQHAAPKSSIDTSPRMGPPPPGFKSYRDEHLERKSQLEQEISDIEANGGDASAKQEQLRAVNSTLHELDDPNSSDSRMAAKRDALRWDDAEARATGANTSSGAATPAPERAGQSSNSKKKRLFQPDDPRMKPENWPGVGVGRKLSWGVKQQMTAVGAVDPGTGEMVWQRTVDGEVSTHRDPQTGETYPDVIPDPGFGQMWDADDNPIADVSMTDAASYRAGVQRSINRPQLHGDELKRESMRNYREALAARGLFGFMDGRTDIDIRARMGQAIRGVDASSLRNKTFRDTMGSEFTLKNSSTDPGVSQYSIEGEGTATQAAEVFADPAMLQTAVGITQGAGIQAMNGPLPMRGDTATATFSQRIRENINKGITDYVESLFKGGASEIDARAAGDRLRKITNVLSDKIVDDVSRELFGEYGGDNGNGQDISNAKSMGRGATRISREAALKLYSESAEVRSQVGNTPIENIVGAGESFVVTDEQNRAVDIGNQPWSGPGVEPRGGRDGGNNLWAGGPGMAMYGAYMLGREWKMTVGQSLAQADRYGRYISSVGHVALENDVPAGSTDVGYQVRQEIGDQYFGRTAYQQFGGFMDVPYIMSGYGDAPGRMAAGGQLGAGIGVGGWMGAKMLGMSGIIGKGAVAALGTAGLVVGGSILAGTLAMEAYNAIAEPEEPATWGNLFRGAEKAYLQNRGWGKAKDAKFGAAYDERPESMAGLDQYTWSRQKQVYRPMDMEVASELTYQEADAFLYEGESEEVKHMREAATFIMHDTGEDQASIQAGLQLQKRLTGKFDEDVSARISKAAMASGMTSAQMEQEGAQYASQLGLLPGSKEFMAAMESYGVTEDPISRARMDYRASRTSALGGQLQALMGLSSDFLGQGAQMVQRFGLNNQARVGAVAGAIGSFQQMGADLSMGQMNQIAQYTGSVNPYVGGVITQATQMAQIAGMSTAGAMTMGTIISDAGMTNQQAFMYDRALGGDTRALSYQAWENGTYANRMYDQSGNAIWETNGDMAMRWLESNMTNLGGVSGVKGFSSLPGWGKFVGLSGQDLASAITGSSNSKILDAFMQYGTRGIEALSRRSSAEAQMAQAGIQLKGIELQENYLWGDDSGGSWNNPTSGSMWGLEDRQRAMQHSFQMAAFGEQQTRMTLSNDFSVQRENNQWQRMQVTNAFNNWQWSQQYNQFHQQQTWAREDWQYQDTTRNLQFSWQMEDINESIRFSSGRERRQLIKQRDRSALSENLESQNIETQRDRQEQLWSQEEERYRKQREYQLNLQRLDTESFEINKKQRETYYKLDQDSFARKMKEYEEERKLQEEITALQRKYQYDQLQLQKEAAQVSAGAAAAQIEYSNALLETSKNLGDAKGFMEQVNSYNMAYRVMNATAEMLKAADGVSTFRIDKIIALLASLKNTDRTWSGEVD